MKWILLLCLTLSFWINKVSAQDTIYHAIPSVDTVIVIKKEVIVKERIIQKTDTLFLRDTLYQTIRDTLRDTISIRKNRRLRRSAKKGIHFKTSIITGISSDFGQLEPRQGASQPYIDQFQNTTSTQLNTSVGFSLAIEKDYFSLFTGIEQYNYKEKYETAEVIDIRKIRYYAWYTGMGYHPIQTEQFQIGLAYAIGFHYNYERLGLYTNPENPLEEGIEDNFFSVRNNIITNYLFIPIEYYPSPSVSFTITPFLNFRPQSMISASHSFEYRKHDIGVRFGLTYTIF